MTDDKIALRELLEKGSDVTAMTVPERLLQDLGVTDPDEIDLEAIAWTMGAEVRYRPLDGCEARILGRDDEAIITVTNVVRPDAGAFPLPTKSGIGLTIVGVASFAAPTTSIAAVRTAQSWRRRPTATQQIS
jgi:hypothetical protein